MNKFTDKNNELLVTLNSIHECGIPYVSWKNNHELGDFLSGDGDIDILVDVNCRTRFLQLVLGQNWTELVNPVAIYPFISHFYKPGTGNRIYHLHVYFRILTGDSWLKEYLLPFEEFLFDNRVLDEDHNIFVLNLNAQRYLFALRHLMKGGSVISRLLYFKELGSYKKEWRACCGSEGWDPAYGPFSLVSFVKGANLSTNIIRMPSFLTSVRLRWSLIWFCRFNILSLPFRRIFSFYIRFCNKVFFRKKKVFPIGGLVIAITGVDGSGKSTLIDEMFKYYSNFITVKQYRLGRPQGHFLELILRATKWLRKDKKQNSVNLGEASKVSVLKALSVTFLALLRLAKARSAFRSVSQGCLVLSDRWPSAELAKMDGPQIDTDHTYSNRLITFLGYVEHWAYSQIPRADVCFVLKVNLDTALKRNSDRIKAGKESDQEIRMRFEENQAVKPIARKVIEFENNGDFELMKENLKQMLWVEIARH